MELDERKKQILSAIVESYINSAEPVGSRSIVKQTNIKLSPATIRNEMCDLEELGMLIQPHASAGRIPSQFGYRVYVDSLMQKYKMTVDEIEELQKAVDGKFGQLDDCLKRLAIVFSKYVDMPTVVALPDVKMGLVHNIKLVNIAPKTIMVILVNENGTIKNKQLRLHNDVDDKFLASLTQTLNEHIAGTPLKEINLSGIMQIRDKHKDNFEMLGEILHFINETVLSTNQTQVFLEGTTNILNYPEYSNIDKAKQILNFFHREESMSKTVSLNQGEAEIKVIIGDENEAEELKDCSMVLANYKVGNNVLGSIGIIGPTRMNYSKVMSKLEFFVNKLSDILAREFSEGVADPLLEEGGYLNGKPHE